MTNKVLGVVVLAAAVGVVYNILKKQPAQAAEIIPAYDMAFDLRYMADNNQIPTEIVSTDDYGGTVDVIEHTIGVGPFHVPRNARESRARIEIDTRNRKVEADYPTFTSGTFIHPELLPPVRTYRIQGGRFIHPELLPPEREVFIQRLGSLRREE